MKRKSNVVLIVMDTVRADHLSCYGYGRKTTPNIDKIAEHGVLFENVFSTAPWTPPSHASIFTGRYPSSHKTLGRNIYLEKNVASLPEILNWNGYRTIGVTCCGMLGVGSGFDRGFQRYFDISKHYWKYHSKRNPQLHSKHYWKYLVRYLVHGPDKGAYQTNEVIKSLLERDYIRKGGKDPFFLFVNYFECHTPYDPPRSFKKRFCKNFNESSLHLKELLLKRIFGRTTESIINSDLDIRKLQFVASGKGGFSFALKKLSVTEKEWDIVKSWYDGEIAYLDFRIGELVDFLRRNDALDDTLIVITSDHGENFGEHGLAVHPLCLYDSLLRVPLIMSCPSSIPMGERFSNLASTLDVFPTITDVVEINDFERDIQGKSLYPFEDEKIHDFICAEYGGLHKRSMSSLSNSKLDEIDKGCKCIRDATYKYIFSLEREELYNIQDDPFERGNILSEYPQEADLLRKKLENTVDINYYGPPDFLGKKNSEKMLDRLKALGYM